MTLRTAMLDWKGLLGLQYSVLDFASRYHSNGESQWHSFHGPMIVIHIFSNIRSNICLVRRSWPRHLAKLFGYESSVSWAVCPPLKSRKDRPGMVWRQKLVLSIGSNWVGSTWRRRQSPICDMLCFKYQTRRWIMSGIVIGILIYHGHKRIENINLLGS
jgi:hypothetical protein